MPWMLRRGALTSMALIAVLAMGCRGGDGPADPLFELMAPERTGIPFVNELRESEALNVITYELIYNGAGVGIGDVNGDGRPDVFLAANMGPSRLYLNEGDFRFRDVTDAAGIDTEGRWANGVAMVDINHDGHLDIYVSVGGPYADPRRRANLLYINNGDGTFAERAAAYGLDDTGHTTQAAFFDYDRDGDLDVYLLTNGIGEVGPNVIRPKQTDSTVANTDRLYRNDTGSGAGTGGDGTFTDVSAAAGIQMEGYGLGIVVFDADRNGWPDVYIANDYLANDLLYVNNGDGTFTDRAADYFRHQSYAAMGTDVADVNNDGWPDVMTLDMLPARNERLKQMYDGAGYERVRSEQASGYDLQVRRNTLQLHNGLAAAGEPSFSEIGQLAGVDATDWSWSALLADFDNDGWRDLLVTNGLPRDVTNRDFANYKVQLLSRYGYNRRTLQALVEGVQQVEPVHTPNYLFANNGDLTFTDVSAAWGIDRPSFSTGAAYADLDGDGDLDLVINNVNEPAFVYRNTARARADHSYLQVQLEGPPRNPAGLGARLAVYSGAQHQHYEHTLYRGYKSTVAPPIHFGLGDAERIDSLIVEWPDGAVQTLESVSANRVVTVAYDSARHRTRRPADARSAPLFAEETQDRAIAFAHAEQHYNDFQMQPLLPHKFSQAGPGLAVGDVNGDGRDDFFVGGAFQQAGQVFLQRADGSFAGRDLAAGPNYEEDMGALLFDADGDGHLDLYVASGGSEFGAGSEYYQDRLYLGEGAGSFQHAPDALPPIRSSTATVVAGDVDRDGDLDLFVGGRVVPNRYPERPESYLLENRGGRFVDVTEAVAPELRKPGLVTAALWTDVNDDGWLDLMVVGEWMPITVFENREGQLVDATARHGLAETVGWWNSIAAGDFDRDGDTDYVAGNLGLNTSLRNRPQGPVRMHVGDFNGDGRLDAVISRIVEGEHYPVAFRDDMIAQLPHLARRFPTYVSYAEAALDDVLPSQEQDAATVYESDTFRTSYIENRGDSAFVVHALPMPAQAAPVFGIEPGDFDGDGLLDLLMIGNSHATEAFTGPYDAFNGLLLRGDGRGGFVPMSPAESGFFADGDGKALVTLDAVDGTRLVLAARNDGALQALRTPAHPDAHHLAVRPSEVRAEITYAGGAVEKVEFYYGSGYLSQSRRSLRLTEVPERVVFVDGQGRRRTWTP